MCTSSRTAAIWTALLAGLLGVARAAPAPHQLGVVSFTPPEGWKVDAPEGGDYLVMTHIDQGHGWYAMIGVYKGRPASGELAASFRAEWTAVVEHQIKTDAPVPQPTIAKLHEGLTAAAGATMGSMGGHPVVAELFVLDGGAQVASIFVVAPSADAMQAYSATLASFLNGVSVQRSGGAPAAPAPAQKTIHVADLAGYWETGAAVAKTFVDSSGRVTGGQNDFGASYYTIKPDGALTYSFVGMMNGRENREHDTGRITIEDGLIVLSLDHHGAQKLHFIDWRETDEGTLLTMLPSIYDPPGAESLRIRWGRLKSRKENQGK